MDEVGVPVERVVQPVELGQETVPGSDLPRGLRIKPDHGLAHGSQHGRTRHGAIGHGAIGYGAISHGAARSGAMSWCHRSGAG